MKPEFFIGKSLFLFIPLLLSACGKASTLIPTLIPPVVSPPSVTKTPSPTGTQRPSPTQGLSHASWSATWNAERTATQEARETVAAQYSVDCDPREIYNYLISPDKYWFASGCYGEDKDFIVANRDGSRHWYIPVEYHTDSHGLRDRVFCGGVPIHWSNDSRYVYYFLFYCIAYDPVPDFLLDMSAYPSILYQMDVLTGNHISFTPRANYFSFSPTGRRLVHFIRTGWKEEEIAVVHMSIVDLRTGEKAGLSLSGFVAVSDIVWSEDGRSFIFAAEERAPWKLYVDRKANYYLYKVNTDPFSYSIVEEFPDLNDPIYPVAWEGNIVTLHLDYYVSDSDYGYNVAYFDMTSKQIITPIPTP